MDVIHSLVTHVRDLRNKHPLKQREPLTLYISPSEGAENALKHAGLKDLLIKMAALDEVVISSDTPEAMHASLVSGRIKAFVVLPGFDVVERRKELRAE